MSFARRVATAALLFSLLLFCRDRGVATSWVQEHLGELDAVSVYVNVISDVPADDRFASQLETVVTLRLQVLEIDVAERGEASVVLEVSIQRSEGNGAGSQFVAVASTLMLEQPGLVGKGNSFHRVAHGVISWDERLHMLVSAELLDAVIAEQVESLLEDFAGGVKTAREAAAESQESPPR